MLVIARKNETRKQAYSMWTPTDVTTSSQNETEQVVAFHVDYFYMESIEQARDAVSTLWDIKCDEQEGDTEEK